MCVANLTEFMLYYYASFKISDSKRLWKGRPASYSSQKKGHMFFC